MPLYYFRLDGEDDEVGIEMTDDAAAREAARDLFGQAIRDGEIKGGASLMVNDRGGRQVAKLSFSEEAYSEPTPGR